MKANPENKKKGRLDDAAQRLGRDLAHSETPDRLDQSQRRKRHAHTGAIEAHGRIAFLTSRANAFLSIPLLFFMGAASHYPMFG